MSEFRINIEGNFLDSFIYSGVLITIDVDGKLCTHSWRHLINEYMKKDKQKKKFASKLIDDRPYRGKKIKFEEDLIIELDQKFLNEHRQGTCFDLDVWTTDLDIKDNILYISSERGLEALPFKHWDFGRVMDFKELYPIWKESKVFGVSTGSWGRTLLAAGTNGALEVFNNVEQNQKIGLKQQDGKVVNSDVCLNCEWEVNSTLAILDQLDAQTVLEYELLISDYDFKSYEKDTEEEIEKKRKVVENMSVENISYLKEYIENGIPTNVENISRYSWFDNKKLVGIDEENNYLFYDFDENKWIHKDNEILDDFSYRKIRQTNAGLMIETEDDCLYKKTPHSSKLLSEDISSWRVFPRSKSYLERIHIVNEDYLQVSIFD